MPSSGIASDEEEDDVDAEESRRFFSVQWAGWRRFEGVEVGFWGVVGAVDGSDKLLITEVYN